MIYHKLSEEIHKKIVEEYLNSNTRQQDIATKYKVSGTMIYNILKKFNVSTDNRRGFYNVDINYFKNIDTANKAYFIGLFHADGCNSESNGNIKIFLKEEDVDVLEKLKKDIKYTGKLIYRIRSLEVNRKNQYGLNITCLPISEDLKHLGYPAKKTYKAVFPKFIHSDLICHFIRGLFDGDGCISYNSKKNKISFGIVGSFLTLEGVKSEFKNRFNIESYISETKSKGIFSLKITKMIDIFTIFNYLYKDAEIYLKRKYDIFYNCFIIKKIHLYWQIYCKDLHTNKEYIFPNVIASLEFFNVKHSASILYCINKSKHKIFRKRYYINLLQNE